jgi:glycosyltransferase involved in cell wall biosynthesis
LLCAGLREQGIEVAVAAPAGFSLEMDTPPPLLPASITALPHPICDPRAVARVADYAERADILHGHGLRGAWIAGLAARRVNRPFVFTAHNLAPANRLAASLLFRPATRNADTVIAVSLAVAYTLTPYGVAPEKITVIPNGIDLAPFDRAQDRAAVCRELCIDEKRRIVVAVGRLSPEKGFDVLLRAAARLRRLLPDICFLLAGDGPERLNIALTRALYGLSAHMYLLGRWKDVPGLLSAADVVAVPSYREGQGIVALEAMAARRPVVASQVGGLIETVQDGFTGLLVPPGDPVALRGALLKLLTDEEMRKRMGAAGRLRVEQHYTTHRMVERTLAVYRQMLERETER